MAVKLRKRDDKEKDKAKEEREKQRQAQDKQRQAQDQKQKQNKVQRDNVNRQVGEKQNKAFDKAKKFGKNVMNAGKKAVNAIGAKFSLGKQLHKSRQMNRDFQKQIKSMQDNIPRLGEGPQLKFPSHNKMVKAGRSAAKAMPVVGVPLAIMGLAHNSYVANATKTMGQQFDNFNKSLSKNPMTKSFAKTFSDPAHGISKNVSRGAKAMDDFAKGANQQLSPNKQVQHMAAKAFTTSPVGKTMMGAYKTVDNISKDLSHPNKAVKKAYENAKADGISKHNEKEFKKLGPGPDKKTAKTKNAIENSPVGKIADGMKTVGAVGKQIGDAIQHPDKAIGKLVDAVKSNENSKHNEKEFKKLGPSKDKEKLGLEIDYGNDSKHNEKEFKKLGPDKDKSAGKHKEKSHEAKGKSHDKLDLPKIDIAKENPSLARNMQAGQLSKQAESIGMDY